MRAGASRLVALHDALAQRHAPRVMEAFVGVARDDPALLTPAEYRGMLRVLLRAEPRSPSTVQHVLLMLEHMQERVSVAPASAAEALVHAELVHMLRDAYVWNGLLTCTRPKLSSMFQMLARGASVLRATDGTPCVPAYTPLAGLGVAPYRAFPDTVTYNVLLHAIVQGARARRLSPVPPSIVPLTVWHTLHTPPTRPSTERVVLELWRHMCQAPHTQPSPISWCIRLQLYIRMGRLDDVHACMRDMQAHDAVSLDALHAVWQAYARTGGTHLHEAWCAFRAQTPTAAWTRATGLDAVPRIEPSATTFGIVTRLLAERGDVWAALRVMHDGLAQGACRVSPATYYALFHALAHTQRTPATSRVLAELMEGYLALAPRVPRRRLGTLLQALRRHAPSAAMEVRLKSAAGTRH